MSFHTWRDRYGSDSSVVGGIYQIRSAERPNIDLIVAFQHRPCISESMAKYRKAAGKRVESAMRRKKKGTLKSGSGRKVRSRTQAIAIGLSEARKKGAKVPRKSSRKRR
jgi:uncharacterized protein DUF6496